MALINNIDIDKLSKYTFYILAIGVTFSNAFTEAATVAIIVLWLIKKVLIGDFRLANGNLKIILALFLLWNLLSLVNTSFINESIRGFGKVLKHSLLFLACLDYFHLWKRIEKFLFFWLGVGFIVILDGIIQYIYGTDLIRQRTINPLDCLHRISSCFVHPNDFGGYLIVILSILFSLLISKRRKIKEMLLLLIIIISGIWSLAATGSRGTWLGFTIAVLYLGIKKSKKLIYLLVILYVISPLFLPASVKSRFSEFSQIVNTRGSLWERTELWKGAIKMVEEHPILGLGVNTYTKNFPKYKPSDYPDIRYTHNSYLQMAAEIGIIGALIFIVLLVAIIRYTGRAVLIFKSGLRQDLSLGLLAGIIGFLIHCAVDTHFYSVTLSAFLFLSLGIAAAIGNIAHEERI